MEFDRKRLLKEKKINAIHTENISEDVVKSSNQRKSFHERMPIWGYTLTVLGVGLTIGILFGGFAYSLTATTDEKLLEDVKYYKDQSRITSNENEDLKHENESLLSENESLQD